MAAQILPLTTINYQTKIYWNYIYNFVRKFMFKTNMKIIFTRFDMTTRLHTVFQCCLKRIEAWYPWCQFQRHFKSKFFVWKCFAQLFFSYKANTYKALLPEKFERNMLMKLTPACPAMLSTILRFLKIKNCLDLNHSKIGNK